MNVNVVFGQKIRHADFSPPPMQGDTPYVGAGVLKAFGGGAVNGNAMYAHRPK